MSSRTTFRTSSTANSTASHPVRSLSEFYETLQYLRYTLYTILYLRLLAPLGTTLGLGLGLRLLAPLGTSLRNVYVHTRAFRNTTQLSLSRTLSRTLSFSLSLPTHHPPCHSLSTADTTGKNGGGAGGQTMMVDWLDEFPVPSGKSVETECDGDELNQADWTGSTYCDAAQAGKTFCRDC